jgi:hypothetical protein
MAYRRHAQHSLQACILSAMHAPGDMNRLQKPVQCVQQQVQVVNPLVLPAFMMGQPPVQLAGSAAAGVEPSATVHVVVREAVSVSAEAAEAEGPSRGQVEPFWSLLQPAHRLQQQQAAAAGVGSSCGPVVRQAWGATSGATAADGLLGCAAFELAGSSSSSPQPPELQLQGLSLQESVSTAELAAAGHGGPMTPVIHEAAGDEQGSTGEVQITPPSSDRSHHMQQVLPALRKSITDMVSLYLSYDLAV